MLSAYTPLAPAALAAGLYAAGVLALRRRGDGWPPQRTGCLVLGVLLGGLALTPPMATYDELFRVHVGQHLLLAMVAPALLALSAPVTLALRLLRPRSRRRLVRLLHSRGVAVVSSPVVAVVLDVGGMYALYLTGLHERAEESPALHAAVHLHMFLGGCLLAWVVVGVDPVRRRTTVTTRLVTLVVASALHDILAKVLYAHHLPAGSGALAERQQGAVLMYYGGTVVDVALAAVVMAQWYSATGRRMARVAIPTGEQQSARS